MVKWVYTDKQRRPGIRKEKRSVREIQTVITELDETISARIYQKNKKRVYQTSPMPNVKSSSHRMLHEDISARGRRTCNIHWRNRKHDEQKSDVAVILSLGNIEPSRTNFGMQVKTLALESLARLHHHARR